MPAYNIPIEILRLFDRLATIGVSLYPPSLRPVSVPIPGTAFFLVGTVYGCKGVRAPGYPWAVSW